MCFKFNTIILELGGALEYTSHPKINQAWIEYCQKMAEYPGKTLDIQNNSPWHNNSIHSENGGGKFLTQKEFLQLVTYCKERYMTIIPEMPSLSHSDYILAAYPNLAERKEDLYPDTCCPLNTQYHKVYQDLLDEVINLLHPEKIHIGHDEYYSVGLCPKCKGKEPHVLYANDINRICKYLEKKHIQPIIWGEKLLNSHWLNKEAIGGAKIPPKKDKEGVPAFYKAANLITSNI